ncbi:divalent-cation tolerance protein CutA [Natrinema pallidum]|uniref:CutA1 divalent ion tolerance protein n=1 Tax=Natrinema pallidum DSM 3751 TaxID=1227495 RepID=L9YEC6_9EURY|nr:divalent-cation tolerance protein CutA [Natrinema pallidum]ELY72464.1 CutA1 divalent ion tolerance protein [Natrinema pallidum DSM 3751]
MPTVYITAPPEAADELAETLVEERLAACVNRLSTTSTYRWEGELHRDDEVVLLAKTTDDAYDDLVDRIRDSHPYDVPCIERFDESDVLESFAAWRTERVD